MTRRGRPPLPEHERQKRRNVTFTDPQWDRVKARAEALGVPAAEFVRWACGEPPSPEYADALKERPRRSVERAARLARKQAFKDAREALAEVE